MKKLILIALPLILLAACGNKRDEIKEFAETFAGYVNAQQKKEVMEVYPKANFGSLDHLPTENISVSEKEGGYRVNFGEGKWIDVEIGTDGSYVVTNSRGVASFPEQKYDIALKTGMIDDNLSDLEVQERLNDEAYFIWLDKNQPQPIELEKGKISKKFGVNLNGIPCEGAVERMTCTVTNNTDKPISGKDYEITYAYSYWTCSDGSSPDGHTTGKRPGVDLAPGASAQINIAIMDYGLKNVALKYNVPEVNLLAGMNLYKGNEYQEYLNDASNNDQETSYDWLSTREAIPADLKNKSSEELRIMRNWIFARHGYIFQSPDLREYFSKYSWYEPTSRNVTAQLNKIEKSNIELIQGYE